jgi:hypothetical protein
MTFHLNRDQHSEINSSDQTIGKSIFFLQSQNDKNNSKAESSMSQYSNQLSKEQVDKYILNFTNLEDLQEEIIRIQKLMVMIESTEFKNENGPYLVKIQIGYFTQIFKALLNKRDYLISMRNTT